MNPVKKIYCRTFQKALRIAIAVLPYREPKIIRSLGDVPGVLMRELCTNVLIITDKGIRSLGLTDRLEEALQNAHIRM